MKLEIVERAALELPGAAKPPASEANAKPRDLESSLATADADKDSSNLVRHADDVLQPVPQVSCADEARAEAEEANAAGGCERVQRDAMGRRPAEDGWCLSCDTQRVQNSCSGEHSMISRAEHRRQDHGVHDAGSTVRADALEDDSEWRGRCALGVQIRVIPRH